MMHPSNSSPQPYRGRLRLPRGSRLAAGFAFDLTAMPEAVARRRVLDVWRPQAVLYRVADPAFLVLVLPESVRVDCAQAPGFPLVRAGDGTLCAADGVPTEELTAPGGSGCLFMLWRGVLVHVVLDSARREDPAGWIDCFAWTLSEVQPLGALPPNPQPPVTEQRAVHEILQSKALAPSAERDALVASLELAAKGERPQGDRRAGFLSGIGVVFSGWLREGAGGVGRTVGRVLSWHSNVPASGKQIARARTVQPRPPGIVSRVRAELLWRLYSLFLWQKVGKRNARQLESMLEMFREGDLTNALRHAIPLGSASALPQMSLPAFGPMRARANLGIALGTAAAEHSVMFGDVDTHMNMVDLLRKTYTDAFERLDREGKTHEAAFVLAELLQDVEAAVAYLEKHGQLRFAAELAEGRKAKPALVVRQWMLAGDVDRAVRIAARECVFAEAAWMLEDKYPEHANLLMLMYARRLMDAGRYAEAVDVVWPLKLVERELKEAWLDLAVAQGGESGARMLVRKVCLCLDNWYAHVGLVKELLAAAGPEAGAARAAFAGEVVKADPGPVRNRLGAVTARALMRDVAELPSHPPNPKLISSLLRGDPVLSEDVPKLTRSIASAAAQDLWHRSTPLEMTFAAPGTMPVCDLAVLPHGRFIAALADAGAVLVDADGIELRRFSCVAHRLIVNGPANRVLAVSRRGILSTVTLLDLDRRRETLLGYVALAYDDLFGALPGYFSGMEWFVPLNDTIVALDTQKPGLEMLWQAGALPGEIVRTLSARDRYVAALLMSKGGSLCHTYYTLPPTKAPVRWYRTTLEKLQIVGRPALLAGPDGFVVWFGFGRVGSTDGVVLGQMDAFGLPSSRLLHEGVAQPKLPALSENWMALPFVTAEGATIVVMDRNPRFKNEIRMRIRLPGARSVAVRFAGDVLGIADSTGRLIQISLADGVPATVASTRI